MEFDEKSYKEIEAYPITDNGKKGVELVVYSYGDNVQKLAIRNFWTKQGGERGISKNVKIPRVLISKLLTTLDKVKKDRFTEEAKKEE